MKKVPCMIKLLTTKNAPPDAFWSTLKYIATEMSFLLKTITVYSRKTSKLIYLTNAFSCGFGLKKS